MKKVIAMILAFSLVFSLAACGLSEKEAGGTSGQTETPAADTEETAAEVEEPGETESAGAEMTADIVVVGGGTAGLAAAVAAANEGAEVIVLEKNFVTGGSGALSSARMNVIESSFVQEQVPDADDSWEVLKAHIEKNTADSEAHPVDWDYLYYNLTTMDETIWLLSDLGVSIEAKASSHGAEVIAEGGGAAYEAKMTEIAEGLGVQILTETPAQSILVEDGKAAGVEAVTADGETLIVHAEKVILATGGSLWDEDAVFDNYPAGSQAAIGRSGAVGDTGDGQAMAAAVGAAIEDGLRLKQSGVEFDQQIRSTLKGDTRPSTGSSVLVTAEGVRFIDETTGGMLMANTMWETGSTYYLIADTANETIAEAMAAAYADGLNLYYGETVAALAEAMGIDAAALEATMDRYNAMCAAGEDTEFGKSAENLVAYEGTAGYYAYEMYGGAYGTMGGGISIDYQGHVLDTNGAVIENLFAAGECADGNIYGEFYVGGCSMGTFTTAGRVAGETAARELAE